MKIAYGVEHIEIEFGQRPFGWRLFLDLEQCRVRTINSTKNQSPGQYLGPVRPLCAIEIPFASLEPELRKSLNKTGFASTDDNWTPKFTGQRHTLK